MPASTLHALSQELEAVESSASNKLFDDLLSTYYTPLEVWYTRSAVDKVLSFFFFVLDDAEVGFVGAPPFDPRYDYITNNNDDAR